MRRGFTLVEIMVTMSIIAILAAISITSFQTTQTKARDSERKNDLQQIASSLEVYYNDKGQYPVSSVGNQIDGCVNEATCTWGAEWSDENSTVYMVTLPQDPRGYLNYYYSSSGTSFQLYARLENNLDNAVPTSSGDPANYGISCGDSNCNYGVSSPNTTPASGRTITAD